MSAIFRLLDVMARLRDPEGGCPWDLEQSFASIAPYTIEEAYEVAETIAAEDWDGLRDELGDLLFQVVFYAQMAREAGLFDFDEVARGAAEKMVRRHPHVFGGATVENAAAQTHAWEAQKAAERSAKAVAENRPSSVLDGIARGLPALSRATKLQARAAHVGFDWPEVAVVFDKISEEISEVRHEMKVKHEPERVAEEIGDLLFACANLARHAGVDAEAALRQGNAKFEHRFRRIEARLAERGRTPAESTLEEMDALWEEIKVGNRE
ncbi:MAG: nucleoside triphosphate pyrophosphohydrolase [Alphaproteobacteria bacterium]